MKKNPFLIQICFMKDFLVNCLLPSTNPEHSLLVFAGQNNVVCGRNMCRMKLQKSTHRNNDFCTRLTKSKKQYNRKFRKKSWKTTKNC